MAAMGSSRRGICAKMGAKPEVRFFGDPREAKGDAAANLKRWKTASGKLQVDKPGKATN